MLTRFNDNTIETKFVKQLVAKTQVPFISTWKPGDFAIRGRMYLSSDAIWRCNHTGYPQNLFDTCTTTEHELRLSEEYEEPQSLMEATTGSVIEVPYFTKVEPYIFGKEYYNITGTYQSNILGYDATTHLYLGQYLRMMRDIFSLDLMPFYNCFCGEYITDIDFNKNEILQDTSNSDYKIASVPVHFGKTYTVALNSEVPIETILVIYTDKGLLPDATLNLNNVSSDYEKSGSTYKKFLRTQFQHPFTLRTKDWHQLYNTYTYENGRYHSVEDDTALVSSEWYDQSLGQFERYLRLLIKIPKTNKSSLVVLEGDYTIDQVYESKNMDTVTWTNESQYGTTVNNKSVEGVWVRPQIIKNYESAYVITENEETGVQLEVITSDATWNDKGVITTLTKPNDYIKEVTSTFNDSQILLSPLSLLQMSDGNSYAFSNRLIEYLLQNVINPLEQFSGNIQRVQQYVKSPENVIKNNTAKYTGSMTTGVWDEGLRKYIFDVVKDSKYLTTKLDLTGYVDKDAERIITRGQNV